MCVRTDRCVAAPKNAQCFLYLSVKTGWLRWRKRENGDKLEWKGGKDNLREEKKNTGEMLTFRETKDMPYSFTKT